MQVEMNRTTMIPGAVRRLTEGETELAAGVFGRALDPARVRIAALPVWPRAFVAGPALVFWPARTALKDFSRAPLAFQAVLVHELVHVWQAQTGVNLLAAKLKAGDGPAAYRYDPATGTGFSGLNIEQQAMVVQHAFLASREGPAPHPAETYAILLAGAPFREGLKPFTA
jgi:hypothetical protein